MDEHLEPQIFWTSREKAIPLAETTEYFSLIFVPTRRAKLAQKITKHAKEKNLYFVTLTEYDPTIESEVASIRQNRKRLWPRKFHKRV